jgi:hypothetical protein
MVGAVITLRIDKKLPSFLKNLLVTPSPLKILLLKSPTTVESLGWLHSHEMVRLLPIIMFIGVTSFAGLVTNEFIRGFD